MIKQINFEDNIFILMMRIRMVRDIITLDADPELFLEKTLDDIYFIDSTLKILLACLEENSRLIEREELLEHHIELEWQFSQVLEEFLDHNGNFSIKEIPALKEKLGGLRNNSLGRQKSAESMGSTGNSPGDEPVVSSDEITELLKAY